MAAGTKVADSLLIAMTPWVGVQPALRSPGGATITAEKLRRSCCTNDLSSFGSIGYTNAKLAQYRLGRFDDGVRSGRARPRSDAVVTSNLGNTK